MSDSDKHYTFDVKKALGPYYDHSEEAISYTCGASRKDSPTRYFNSISIYILSFMSAAEYDAKIHGYGDKYIGIYGKKLVEIMSGYGVSKNEIENTLYNLVRRRFILFTVDKSGGINYRLNVSDPFICYKGIYMFTYDRVDSKYNRFIGYCNMAPFCNRKHGSCSLPSILLSQYKGMIGITDPTELKKLDDSPFFEYLKKITSTFHEKMTRSSKYLDSIKSRAEKYKKNLPLDDLNEVELEYYASRLYKGDDERNVIKEIEFVLDKGNFVTIPITNVKHQYTINYKRMAKHYIDDDVQDYEIERKMWFSPIMSNIMHLLSLAEMDSKERFHTIDFPGLSLYWIQLMTRQVWVSNETIYEHVYRLTRLRYLHKVRYKKGNKPTNTKGNYFFKLNKDRFPCYRGIYTLYIDEPLNYNKIYTCVCEKQPFCNGKAKSCTLPEVLREKIRIVTEGTSIGVIDTFVSQLEERLEEWKEDEENVEKYREILEDFIDDMIDFGPSYPYSMRKYDFIFDLIRTVDDVMEYLNTYEIVYFGKMIEEGTDEDQYLIWDAIINTIYTVEFKKKKRNRTKSKVNRKLRDSKKAEILRQILEGPIERKIQY